MLLTLALAALAQAPDYPHVRLKVAGAEVTVFTPDPAKGFYRGSRFAWAGVVKDLKFDGHTVFGPWKDGHNPIHNDDITGPAEEFGMHSPLGYAEAEPGGRFVKIGVGELVKPKEAKYGFFTNYTVADPGVWKVSGVTAGPEKGAAAVRCEQTLKAANGYGYTYAKTVRLRALEDGYAALVLAHELTNTGGKPIDTDVYNHNFFNVDGKPVGPDYWLVFTEPVRPAPGFNAAGVAEFRDLRYMFGRVLDKESPFGLLVDARGRPQDHFFQMTYARPGRKVGLRVSVSSGLPVTKFQTWSVRGCLCPEPFSPVKLAPGQKTEWTINYLLNNTAAVR